MGSDHLKTQHGLHPEPKSRVQGRRNWKSGEEESMRFLACFGKAQAAAARREWDETHRELDAQNAEAFQTILKLECFCGEVQHVLQEALTATSWTECRHLLYHESLRYVATAATHGRGAAPSFSAGLRPWVAAVAT